VTLVISKLIIAVIDSVMLRVSDINQSIIAAPAVTVDDGVNGDLATNNGLSSRFSTVRDDLCIDPLVTLEKTEDDGLPARTATALATHAMRAEVRFINFNFAIVEWRLTLAFFCDASSDFAEDHDY
jgi:hypothetical protein